MPTCLRESAPEKNAMQNQYTEQWKISNDRFRFGQEENIKHRVLSEDKLDDNDTQMATSPTKSMRFGYSEWDVKILIPYNNKICNTVPIQKLRLYNSFL
jgi:hypothetical protein